MKALFTLAALLISTLSAPAFANDWDMGTQNNLNAQQYNLAPAEFVAGTPTNSNGMQWDTSALNSSAAATQAADIANYEYQMQLQEEARHNRRPGYAPPLNGKPNLARTQFGRMTPGSDYGSGNGVSYGGVALPTTTLESFVANAGGNADQIYGDEGTSDIPPFFGFSGGNTIDSGMSAGLTTYHQSGLPGAWTSY